jgi:Galactose oxidase, central domain
MRHPIGLGVVLLLVATGGALASGNSGPPCRYISWVPTGNMTTPRLEHAAALLPSGKVLVAGGGPDGFATAELYDPATGTWSATGSMSIQRFGHTMTLLPTGKVLVAGGGDLPAELYDPDTGQWTKTGAMLLARRLHTATLLPTGKVLVVGGHDLGLTGPLLPLASAELYDPGTGEWHPTGALSTARVGHTATLLASGQVLVLGGSDSKFSLFASAELYDPAAGAWTPAAPMLAGRDGHSATLLTSGAVLVAGGLGLSSRPVLEAEIYDPAARTWRRTGSLFAPHAGHTATLLPSGKVLVVGGGVGVLLANTELFDPESEIWSDAGCTVTPIGGQTATLLPSGAVLVAGGSEGTGISYGISSGAELYYGLLVSPAQVSLAPGAKQTFTASGGSGLGYVWSLVHNESGGTVTASGDYQAGATGGVTDVVQVVDSFANSSIATVNVLRQATAVSSTAPQAKSMGCGTTGGDALPALGGIVLGLLGWTVRHRRRWSPATASGRVEDGVAPV